LADHSSPKAGRGTELLALRKELKAIEEKRSEEALKLLGEVSDRRQVGCFWLVASVLMLLSCGVVWLVRYPDRAYPRGAGPSGDRSVLLQAPPGPSG